MKVVKERNIYPTTNWSPPVSTSSFPPKNVEDHLTPYTVRAVAPVWYVFSKWPFNRGEDNEKIIDLVTVFDAILTSRQSHDKLQCLYENLMSNYFHKTVVLNKISIVNESNKAKDCPKKFWGRTRAWISPEACFRFSIYFSVIFMGLSNRQMYRKFKKVVLGLLVLATPSNCFRRILRSEALVYKSYVFQSSRSTEIIRL